MSEELQKLFRYNCTLDRVIDGDTVDLNIDLGFSVFLNKQRVRLAGIDTPESRTRNQIEKRLGLQAKQLLTELCKDGFVLESLGRGKYGRLLGILWNYQGFSINQQMIDAELAVEYWGGKKTKVWV